MNNPFLQPYHTLHDTTPFQQIRIEDYEPAVREGMRLEDEEIQQITGNPEEPTFQNTILALEHAGKALDRVTTVLFNLLSAETCDALEEIAEKLTPALSEHANNISLNEQLFARVKAVYDKRESLQLTPEERRLLEKSYDGFVRNGANLSEEDKATFRKLSMELSSLTLKFSQNHLKETNGYELVLHTEDELAGLPESAIEAAAHTAHEKGKEGCWVITLQAPSYVPFMKYSDKREVRKTLYMAYNTQCCHDNEFNNLKIVEQLVNLRMELAQLLGFKNYAEYVLKKRMAEHSENVYKLLNDLLEAYTPTARQEVEEIRALARELEGEDFELMPWDFSYYAEKLKSRKFSLDEEALRPYFELSRVKAGVFGLATRLYGITFKENKEMPVYHPDGNFSGQGSWTNMVATQAISGERKNKENDLWLTGGLKITPLKDWTINVDYTYNMYILSKKQHGKEILEHTANPDIVTVFPHTTPSRVKFTTDDNYYQTFNAYTDYSKSLGKHNIKLLLGYNYETKSYRWFNAERENLISNDLAGLGQAYGEKYNGSGQHSWATMGYFARINYNYDERYLLELNGRYDGSSKFPKDKRFVFFPSVSAAWRISSEAFFEPAKKIVDELKIRASYGSLGNQSVGGDYPYIATMGTNGEMGYLVDGKKIASVSPGGIVSPYLTWETVRQIDLGLDWALLNSRLYGTFDWYMRKTLDMVTNGTPLPAVLGTGAPQANTADLKTTGWELSMGWRDRVNKDFSYDVSFVLSDYQAEITKFNNPQNLLSTHYVGKKWGEIWGLVTEGLFQSAEEVSAHADQSEIYGGGWYPGDVKYKDLNGDGKINKGKNTLDDPGDQKIIGNSEPRYSYGIKGGLQWRDFDFDVFFQGIGKKDVVLGGNQFWGFGNEWHVPFKHALDSWTEDNRNAYFPRSTYDNVTGNRETQTRYLQNAAYLRLKSITLGYSLPKALLAKWKIDHVRFYVSGQNLLTFDHLFDIYDPETVSLSTYPLTKSVSFGLNITL